MGKVGKVYDFRFRNSQLLQYCAVSHRVSVEKLRSPACSVAIPPLSARLGSDSKLRALSAVADRAKGSVSDCQKRLDVGE